MLSHEALRVLSETRRADLLREADCERLRQQVPVQRDGMSGRLFQWAKRKLEVWRRRDPADDLLPLPRGEACLDSCSSVAS
jgi:hypothetical protein